jgi:hypothetical protein
MERYATGDATLCACNRRWNLRPIGEVKQPCQRVSAMCSGCHLASRAVSKSTGFCLQEANYPQQHTVEER